MSVAFKAGQELGQDDLYINIRDDLGNLVAPFSIVYNIFDSTTGADILIGQQDRDPVEAAPGKYYAKFYVPLDANIGSWNIRWEFRETPTSPAVQVLQEFAVVGENVIAVGPLSGTEREATLIKRLRIILRDNNPDRNYRFRPPNTERFIQSQTEVFGYIWTDEELAEYVYMAIDDLNAAPPFTEVYIHDMPVRWFSAVVVRAAVFALLAASINWIADELTYSISGVSLDIEKSSKYQAMGEAYQNQYDKMKEEIKDSIKITKGLRQSKYGMGISSALGPYSKVGVVSRRNFIGGYA